MARRVSLFVHGSCELAGTGHPDCGPKRLASSPVLGGRRAEAEGATPVSELHASGTGPVSSSLCPTKRRFASNAGTVSEGKARFGLWSMNRPHQSP